MEEEIIDKIIAIPLSEWKDCETNINGIPVSITPTIIKYRLKVGEICFYGQKVDDLWESLYKYKMEQEKAEEKANLKVLYDKIFKP